MHHRNGTERGGWARVGRALVYLPAVYLLLALLAHGVPGEVYRQAAGQDLAGTVFEYEQGSVRYVIQEEAGRPAFLKLGPRGWFLFPQSLCRREAAISFTGPEGGPPPASGWRSIADGFPAQGAEGLFLEDFLTWYEEGDRREGVLHLGVALDRPPDLAGMEVLFLEEWAGTGHVFAAISNTKEQQGEGDGPSAHLPDTRDTRGRPLALRNPGGRRNCPPFSGAFRPATAPPCT